jgi:hypothetical protein
MKYVDPTGQSTWVVYNPEAMNYTVVGGDLSDDSLNIYVVEKNENNEWVRTNDAPIGQTATMYSFFDVDGINIYGWQVGTVIDPIDYSGILFLQQMTPDVGLAEYMSNARTNHIWDFKVTNGVEGHLDSPDIYRGMPISNGVYASARDVGNIAAGLVGGTNGLSWFSFRLGCDVYQTYEASKRNESFTPSLEGASTISAQRYGWEIGINRYLSREKK